MKYHWTKLDKTMYLLASMFEWITDCCPEFHDKLKIGMDDIQIRGTANNKIALCYALYQFASEINHERLVMLQTPYKLDCMSEVVKDLPPYRYSDVKEDIERFVNKLRRWWGRCQGT